MTPWHCLEVSLILDVYKSADFKTNEIGLVFIKEPIDFTTLSGKLMFTMLGAIAEF